MSDFPSAYEAQPTHISSMMSGYFPVAEMKDAGTFPLNSSSTAWPTANLAMYIPFSLPHSFVARRLFWANGSSAGSEWDAGIYTSGGDLLASVGKVAGTGNSALQYASLATELDLDPGSYLFGLAHNSTTVNRANLATITAIQGRLGGLTQQGTAFALPTSVTPAKWELTAYPICGMARTSSGI